MRPQRPLPGRMRHRFSSASRSARTPRPVSMRLSSRVSWKVPPLHGGHWPQEPSAKKLTYSATLRTMLVPSDTTIIAPCPGASRCAHRVEVERDVEVALVSRVFEGPPVNTALNSLPCSMPPPCSKTSSSQARAHRQLVQARTQHVAGERIELGARRLAEAQAAIPVRAMAQDARHMRERLGVVHDGRRAVHALLGRKGRLAAREGKAALDGGDHRRFLAADVEARARHDRERQRPPTTARSLRRARDRATAARPRARRRAPAARAD